VRPTHAVVVLRDGTRAKVANSETLRRQVLAIAGRIRRARANPERPLTATGKVAKCRACAQRHNCDHRHDTPAFSQL
jgi:hypothetical protein